MAVPCVLTEEPQLDRQQRMLTALDIDVRSDAFRLVFAPRHARQVLQGLMSEDVTWLDQQARLAGATDQLQRDDGIAAKLEEIVLDTDDGLAEQLGPDRSEHRLGHG